MFTEDDFLFFEECMTSDVPNDRKFAMMLRKNEPSGDPRVLPYLESALEDRTVLRVWIPITYGEVRVIAAYALAAERAAQGIDEPVEMGDMPAPLHTDVLGKLEVEHGITNSLSGDESGIMSYCTLRDLGLIPKITWGKKHWDELVEKYKK
jgi:hypothetical protein